MNGQFKSSSRFYMQSHVAKKKKKVMSYILIRINFDTKLRAFIINL